MHIQAAYAKDGQTSSTRCCTSQCRRVCFSSLTTTCQSIKSRKVHAPFWVGHARCRSGDCPVFVTMYINSQPMPHIDVLIWAVVYSDCSHFTIDRDTAGEMQLPNRRFLSDSLGHKMAHYHPKTGYWIHVQPWSFGSNDGQGVLGRQ